MLIDLQKDAAAEVPTADVCIVGAGAAGITLARNLAGQGVAVVLLESGGFDFEQETQALYRGPNVGMPYYDLDESRLRFFGGTVAIWGGRCAVLDPIDFTERAWVPYSGWPIDRAALDPFYRRANAQLDLGDFNYDRDVWRTLGVADPGFDPARIDTELWRFDEVMERFAAAQARDLIDSPRVTVVLHANVTAVEVAADGGTATGLQLASLSGRTARVRAQRFVLACGAIENARLLLASDAVEPGGIGNRRDLVGRFFMEHPAGRIGRIRTDRPYELWAKLQKRFMPAGPPLAPALRLGDATQAARHALNSIATVKLQRDPKHGVALGNRLYHGLKHSIAPTRRGRALDHLYRNVRSWVHRNVRHAVERGRARAGLTGLYAITRGEQAPNPASRVLLTDERDALGVRRAALDWRLTEIDKHTALVLAETLDAELRRLQLGTLDASPWLREPGVDWPVDPTIGNHPLANYHQLGGTRMSQSPADGVVDANCRVHGYDNLYVTGGSVFPTGGWANPTLTIIALAHRLGDHLATQVTNRG